MGTQLAVIKYFLLSMLSIGLSVPFRPSYELLKIVTTSRCRKTQAGVVLYTGDITSPNNHSTSVAPASTATDVPDTISL